MREYLRAGVVVAILSLPAGAGAQTQPAGELNVVKLSKLPDSVPPATQKIPDEFATKEARQIREILPGDPQRADAFHNALVEAGFDVSQGAFTKGGGETVVFETKGPEGTTRVVGVPTFNGVLLHKLLVLPTPGLPPVVFRQPPPVTTPGTSTTPFETVPPTNPFSNPSWMSDTLPPGERPFIYVPPGTVFPPEFFDPVPDRIRQLLDEFIEVPPADELQKVIQEFKDDLNKYLESRTGVPAGAKPPFVSVYELPVIDPSSGAAVNVTDAGLISGFTLIEGGCDFLDDGSPFGGDRCRSNGPSPDPGGDWPNVMVQVLDLDGVRSGSGRDGSRVEKVHILGSGGPELLGNGSGGLIKDLAPATYDNSVQYEVITVRVEIQSAVRNGFNLLRDWLLRRPQAVALAARSAPTPFAEQARPAPSRSRASGSRTPSAVSLLVTSTGTSTGEAFRVQALANSPITFDLTSVVAEPLKGVKPNAIAKASSMFGARGAQSATGVGYCLEFLRQPPSAGMLYRIAGPEIQKRFEPLRKIANAARRLADAGQLTPDSDPKSFMHSIAQWAVWTGEQKFTEGGFTKAFVDHTKKQVEAAGRPWQREYAQAVEKIAPGRWQQIQKILRLAAG